MDDIYSKKILEFAAEIDRIGSLDDAHGISEKSSKLCGSKVKVYIKLEGDDVADFRHEVRACALGQTSSSIMSRNVVGASIAEIKQARADMLYMLNGSGEGPTGRFENMRYLLPVKDYKARHGSVMLTFDATVEAIDNALKEALAAS